MLRARIKSWAKFTNFCLSIQNLPILALPEKFGLLASGFPLYKFVKEINQSG
jgi:hypothetical protein